MKVKANANTHLIFEKGFDDYVDQLWAEAVQMYFQKVSTLLSREAEAIAEEGREEHYEADPRTASVEAYLSMLVPTDWGRMYVNERRMYFREYDASKIDPEDFTLEKMDFVSIMQIATDVFEMEVGRVTAKESREIAAIMSKIPGWQRSAGRKAIMGLGCTRGYERIVNE